MRACPRGVKATSGLCLWPDSLGTTADTSRSSVGAGLRPGKWAVGSGQWLGITFPRHWEPRLGGPDPQHRVFEKEVVCFIQESG